MMKVVVLTLLVFLPAALCAVNPFAKQLPATTLESPLQEITCPGGQYACPSGDTCCPYGNVYLCCPLPNAVCCTGTKYCCPNGYTCSGTKCYKSSDSGVLEKIPILIKRPAV